MTLNGILLVSRTPYHNVKPVAFQREYRNTNFTTPIRIIKSSSLVGFSRWVSMKYSKIKNSIFVTYPVLAPEKYIVGDIVISSSEPIAAIKIIV